MASALLGALSWGSCQSGKATAAQIRLEEALAKHGAATDRWQDERTDLARHLTALRVDSASLARAYASARFSATQARHRADSLVDLVPDSLQGGIRLAFDSMAGVITACEAIVTNCERRAANAEARVQGDSVLLQATQLLLDSTAAMWHSAERRAQPNFFRDAWRARAVTLPLLGITAFLLVTRP